MNLKQCYSSLQEGFNMFESLFANRRFCQVEQSIVWYEFGDPRFSAVLDSEEFSIASETDQYSFQFIEDGSLVRLSYVFCPRGREIKQASLSYIQSPSTEILCQRYADDKTGGGYLGHCHWLRIDYEPESASCPTHMACHLHVSSLPTTRIPLSRLPTPKQFIGWVVSIVSPKHLSELVDRSEHMELNAPCFVDHWEGDLAPFFFLAVPPSDAQGKLAALGK